MTQYEIVNIPGEHVVVDHPGRDVRIIAAGSVRVVMCRNLYAQGATIGRSLDVRDAAIGGSLYAQGATIGGSLDVSGATIDGSLDAQGATIGGSLYAQGATIDGSLDAQGATIGGSLYVSGATIDGSLDAQGATIGGSLDARGATIDGYLNVSGATIDGHVYGDPAPDEIEMVEQILSDIEVRKLSLDMGKWHGVGWSPSSDPGDYCNTTHCLAGAAQCLSDDPTTRSMKPVDAGRKLLPNFSHLFYVSDGIALKEMKRLCETDKNADK